MASNSTLVRDYICRVCGSHLVVKPGGGRCAADPVHFSWIPKVAVEREAFKMTIEALDILRAKIFIETIPGWPQPERPTVEQCLEELYS